MPNGFDIANALSDKSVPLFAPTYLWIGLGLAIFSIIFSILSWRGMKGIFQPDQRARGILLWCINAALFIFALTMLTKAFPRVSPAVVLAVFFVLSLAIAGGTAVTKKKVDEASDSRKGDTAKSRN